MEDNRANHLSLGGNCFFILDAKPSMGTIRLFRPFNIRFKFACIKYSIAWSFSLKVTDFICSRLAMYEAVSAIDYFIAI